jgi:2,3-diketo-5-methylthio-1-phosphopentane phosphatase
VLRAGVRAGRIRREDVNAPAVRAIILDIEGTTTPIAFVTETLFPYARRHLGAYLDAHAASSEDIVERLRTERQQEDDPSCPPWSDRTPDARRLSVMAYVGWLMDRDRKSPPLKELQGRIWQDGYRSGELIGEVFPDVPGALERWRRAGMEVGIFSSGSVLAQQLLFRYSSAGDLTKYLRWHFDTAVGPKNDPESYARIASHVEAAPAQVLFVSDVVRELDAARAAGMQTFLSVRPGNAGQPAHGHRVAATFDNIPLSRD